MLAGIATFVFALGLPPSSGAARDTWEVDNPQNWVIHSAFFDRGFGRRPE